MLLQPRCEYTYVITTCGYMYYCLGGRCILQSLCIFAQYRRQVFLNALFHSVIYVDICEGNTIVFTFHDIVHLFGPLTVND